jgi:hypothetical protein
VATEWEGNKPGRRRKKNLWTRDMTDVRNGKEINQEEEEKKTLGQRI